jgi:sirohydrochlorin cobaltochelatase
MKSETALLLMGHGSRDHRAIEQFYQFFEKTKEAFYPIPVSGGFLEFASPDLKTAVKDLIKPSVKHIVIVPLVLLGAGHQKTDGPQLIHELRHIYPEIKFSYASALGIHPLVLSVYKDRVADSLSKLPADNRGLLIVSRGSTDPDANSDLYKIARLISDDYKMPCLVEPAFISLAKPSVKDGLDRLYLLGARNITVVPYFIFTGILFNRIIRQASDWASQKNVNISFGAELKDDDAMIELIRYRYENALSQNNYVNCDLCAYRVPMAGYEDKHVKAIHAHVHG